jgi:hypothetical protein
MLSYADADAIVAASATTIALIAPVSARVFVHLLRCLLRSPISTSWDRDWCNGNLRKLTKSRSGPRDRIGAAPDDVNKEKVVSLAAYDASACFCWVNVRPVVTTPSRVRAAAGLTTPSGLWPRARPRRWEPNVFRLSFLAETCGHQKTRVQQPPPPPSLRGQRACRVRDLRFAALWRGAPRRYHFSSIMGALPVSAAGACLHPSMLHSVSC